MHQLIKYFLACYFLSFNIFLNAGDLSLDINYESGIQLDSQKAFIKTLSVVNSKKELKLLLDNQDWISSYTMRSLPFDNEVKISIKNRIPIFILNNTFYVDEELKKFKFLKSVLNFPTKVFSSSTPLPKVVLSPIIKIELFAFE